MANWLEEEEHKKQLLLQSEEAARKHLQAFYDLCNRVNGVRPNSLEINRLRVEGTRTFSIRPIEHFEDGGSMGVWGRRGIHITSPTQDEVLIDAFINEHHYFRDAVCGDLSSDKEKVVIRKKCAFHDLSEWREDQILHAIRWMMAEAEAIKDSIPGTEIMTEEAIAEAEARRLEAEKMRSSAIASGLSPVSAQVVEHPMGGTATTTPAPVPQTGWSWWLLITIGVFVIMMVWRISVMPSWTQAREEARRAQAKETQRAKAKRDAEKISEGFIETVDKKGERMFVRTFPNRFVIMVFSDGHLESFSNGRQVLPGSRMFLSKDEKETFEKTFHFTFSTPKNGHRTEEEVRNDLLERYSEKKGK